MATKASSKSVAQKKQKRKTETRQERIAALDEVIANVTAQRQKAKTDKHRGMIDQLLYRLQQAKERAEHDSRYDPP